MSRRAIFIAAALGLVVALAWALRPIATSSGYTCDGIGGAIRWQAGAGNDARTAAARRQTDMSKVLSDLAHNPSIANTPLGREARDDANDAHNRAQHSLPQLDTCDATASSRLLWATPIGVVVFGAALGLAWLTKRVARALRSRPRPDAPKTPSRCPLCGEPLGVDEICAACSGFQAGLDGDWRKTLPDAPPREVEPRT